MRPDLDDYEEVSDQPELDNSRSRAMSWLVLGVAIAGFGALAYYAYHSGAQSIHEGDTLVVEAEKTPLKEAPANPEGEQFANKDKTIYDVIAGDHPDKKVEKLLPDAEHPTALKPGEKPSADDGYEDADINPSPATNTTTFVNKAAEAPKAVDAVDAAMAKKEVPAKAEVKPAEKAKVEVAKPAEKAAKPEVPAVAPSAEAPTMINEKPTAEKKEAPAAKTVEVAAVPVAEKPVKVEAAPAKLEAKPQPKPVLKAAEVAASGPYKIQLGAFQSDEEARGQWKKITTKFAGVIKGSPIIVRAELDNGTYYRLRAGGFASADAAKQACATLSAKSQPCFPVGK